MPVDQGAQSGQAVLTEVFKRSPVTFRRDCQLLFKRCQHPLLQGVSAIHFVQQTDHGLPHGVGNTPTVRQVSHTPGQPFKVDRDKGLHVDAKQGSIQVKQNSPNLVKGKVATTPPFITAPTDHLATIS